MRRLSRIYEPLLDSATTRLSAQTSSRYVCRTCLRQRTAVRVPASQASQLSTSARQLAWTDKIKDVGSALRGEKTLVGSNGEAANDDAYEPAETWDGLEWVGTKQWYEDQKRPQEAFQGYGKITAPMRDCTLIRDELLKSIVEVFTAMKAAPKRWQASVEELGIRNEPFPQGVRIGCDAATGEAILEFENLAVETEYLGRLKPVQGLDGQSETTSTSEVEEVTTSSTPTADFAFADLRDQNAGKWSLISLDNLDVRFAVAKRVQQRTGVRLTDPQITHARTAGAMFIHLWKPEKPKKLADGLLLNEALKELPNVKIAKKRLTIVHKEREVGRWKVIEEELNERGIPSLGRPDIESRAGRE